MAKDWYINFDVKRKNVDLNPGETLQLSAEDKRSHVYLAYTNQATLEDILCNYIDMYNSLRQEYKATLINGRKYTNYSYLEFGMMPVVFLPIEVLGFEAELYTKMMGFLSNNNIKTYVLPSYDFIKGRHLYDEIHFDIWAKREDIAKLTGKSVETVSVKDFIKLFLEDFVNEY